MGAVVAHQVDAHYAAATPGAHGVGLAMALSPPLTIALMAATRTTHRAWLLPLWLLVCPVLWVVCAPLAAHLDRGLYPEHVGFNLIMAHAFGRTLMVGYEPLCMRFAHMVYDAFTPCIVHYSRQITLVRTLFLLATTAVLTLLLATASVVTWSTSTNYLSLSLVGVVFATEYLCRRIVLCDEPHSSLSDAVRAYRQSEQSGYITPATTERSR